MEQINVYFQSSSSLIVKRLTSIFSSSTFIFEQRLHVTVYEQQNTCPDPEQIVLRNEMDILNVNVNSFSLGSSLISRRLIYIYSLNLIAIDKKQNKYMNSVHMSIPHLILYELVSKIALNKPLWQPSACS